MALLAGSLVLSFNAREIERRATNLERILTASMTGYRQLHELQRDLQQAAVNQGLQAALVVDARGVVLVASDADLVNLPLPHVLQLACEQPLKALFADCPSKDGVVSCLNQYRRVFVGPLPWLGGDFLVTMRQSPLALEGRGGGFGDRATLITVVNLNTQRNEALTLCCWSLLPAPCP